MMMRELATSMLSFSSAMSVFGAEQIASAWSLRTHPLSQRAASVDAITQAAKSQLDDELEAAFERLDRLQRESIEFAGSVASGDTAGALTAGSQIVGPFINAAKPLFAPLDPLFAAVDRIVPGADFEVRWQEFNNQLEIFLLVPSVESRLGIQPGAKLPLSELVDRAYELGPFRALWAVEGLGHYYGNRALKDDDHPQGLLVDPAALQVRDGSLTMLNAGIGLSFAQELLLGIKSSTPDSVLRETVQRILELDRENATPGYEGAAYESLGLVTRTFHRSLVNAIDRVLQESAPELLGYYWHGVGRAHYFAPSNLVPCSEINWATIANSAPNESAHHNFIAGLAWAVTVVNMRQPQIMANILRRQGQAISHEAGFVNGVESSTIMRKDTTPDAAFIDDFCQFRPTQEAVIASWESQVARPCREAVSQHYPVLKQRKQLGEVFQYHQLSQFTRT